MLIPRRGGIYERVYREEWNLALVDQSADDIAQRGLIGPIRWWPPQERWYGLADPACYTTADGGLLLFAERLNWLTGRGEIWAAVVPPGGDPIAARFSPWARAATHLSYPFPFFTGGTAYLTMETSGLGALFVWRMQDGRWVQRKIMDRPALDPTFWHGDGWWLFCTFADDDPDRNLHLFYADSLDGPWQSHPSNPVKIDLGSARPAGPLFRSAGRLIRPSQDSTKTYGGGVVLNEIIQLDRWGFREQSIRHLAPIGAYMHGLHTLCPAGARTIIDGKRWGHHPLDWLRYPMTGMFKQYRRYTGTTGTELSFVVDKFQLRP